MNIELKKVTVRELVKGYKDNQEDGVVGYGGKLDIRPPYQREFIYEDKQRDAVIETVNKGFPLNVMYWAVRKEGGYEIIDGQQRTISICEYVKGNFSIAWKGKFSTDRLYFHNLTDDQQEQIYQYPLMVYECSGTESEKLDWFKIVNISGVELRDQELRNAVYAGSWVSDAKRYFSKTNCAAYGLASSYLAGTPIRQDYLETAIQWFSKDDIEGYMGEHQDDPSANELWLYFQGVISWVKATFVNTRKEMKHVPWGFLYNEFKTKKINPNKLEKEIAELMQDEDIKNKKGIYEYVLNRQEKHLNIRAFSDKQKRESYERQKGICSICKKHFELNEMEADHITPWSKGGKTEAENCQMLCQEDNRRKLNK